MFWTALAGAVIGAFAALGGQWFGHELTRGRERRAATRTLAADVLAWGRAVQALIGAARQQRPMVLDTAALRDGNVPFIRSSYEFKWLADDKLVPLLMTYQNEMQRFIENWAVELEGDVLLDADLAQAANAFEAEVAAYIKPKPNAAVAAYRQLRRR